MVAHIQRKPPEIAALLHRIEPALADLPPKADRDELVAAAVERNVELAVAKLSRVPALRTPVECNGAKIVGAVYDMHTSEVGLV
jgi:carbonic anhydrase